MDLISHGNVAPNNAGPILAWDFLMPALLLLSLRPHAARTGTRAARRNADPAVGLEKVALNVDCLMPDRLTIPNAGPLAVVLMVWT
jgi:hypothetical protein